MQFLRTHHIAITTERFELLRAFYVETLGLKMIGGFPGQEIVFLDAGTTTIELIGEAPGDEPGSAGERGRGAPSPGYPMSARASRLGWHHLAFEVADVDAAFAELADRGVEVHSSPEGFPPAAPTMRIAFLADPDGNLIELVQPLGSRYPAIGGQASPSVAST